MSAIKAQRKSQPLAEQSGPIIREHETWNVGDVAHQGDLILVCIDGLPKSARTRSNRQLAVGSTIGSRHVLTVGNPYDADPQEVAERVRRATNNRVNPEARYVGPVFDGDAALDHPQHQTQKFPCAGNTATAVLFQRNVDAEEREARALD